jgi:hypothetical protein
MHIPERKDVIKKVNYKTQVSFKLKTNPRKNDSQEARYSGMHLQFQLLGRQRSERLQFGANTSKKLSRPHLNK